MRWREGGREAGREVEGLMMLYQGKRMFVVCQSNHSALIKKYFLKNSSNHANESGFYREWQHKYTIHSCAMLLYTSMIVEAHSFEKAEYTC